MTRAAALWFMVRMPVRTGAGLVVPLTVLTVVDALGGLAVAVLMSTAVRSSQLGQDPITVVAIACVILAVSALARALAFVGQVAVAERARHLTDLATVASVGGRPRIDHFDSPEFLDDLRLLRRDRARVGTSAMVVFQCLGSALRIVSILLVLVWVHPVLLLLLVGAVVSAVAGSRAEQAEASATQEAARNRRRADALLDVMVGESGHAEARAFGSAAFLLDRHDQTLEAAVLREQAGRSTAFLTSLVGWVVFGATYAVPLTMLVLGVEQGTIGVAEMVVVVMLATMLLTVVREALSSFSWVLSASTTVRRYLRVVGSDLSVPDDRPDSPVERLEQGITLSNVTFRYPGASAPALTEVQLDLRAGEVVALVGENGAGKSTLMSLLLAAYAPDKGRLLVDGHDLPPAVLNGSSTGMLQDFVRYDLTLRQNVGLGCTERVTDDEAVEAALLAVGAPGLAGQAPEGLDVRLGDGGQELSGGQWQRVAAARAFMRDAPVLRLFDEPASSLDPDAESALYDAIIDEGRRLGRRHGTVTVVVTHRLATVASVDRVVYLENGRVIAQGTHDEVLAACVPYARLYAIQAGGYA